MRSTKIKPRKYGVNPNKLNPQELLFVNALAADVGFNATQAVRECYPKNKNPTQYAQRLLSRPRIQKMLGKVLQQRLDRLELKADDVLEYLRFALFFNPLDYFHPTKDGKWVIADLASLPPEVGRLIDKMKLRVTENKDGSITSMFEVELVSKTTCLGLAMKHIGIDGEKPPVAININWDALSQGSIDLIEQRLLEESKDAS